MTNWRLPNSRLLIGSLITASLSTFQCGYHLGVLNIPEKIVTAFVNQSIASHYGAVLDDHESTALWSFIVNIYNIGGIFGAWSTILLADRFGRKRTLMLFNSVFALVAAVLMGSADWAGSVELLTIGRLIVGFNAGLATGVLGIYLTECSPVEFRGFTGSLVNTFICTSTLFAQVVALPNVLGSETLWPILLALGAVPAALQLLLIPIFPESPKHLLLTSGDETAARKAIRFYHGRQVNVETAFEEFHQEKLLADSELTMKEALKDANLRWPILLSVVVNIVPNATGITAIFSYSTNIFMSAGISGYWAQLATTGMSVCNTLGSFVGLLLMERCGRRPLMLIGSIVCIICDLIFMISALIQPQIDSSWPSILGLAIIIVHVTVYNIGPGPIAWFISSELTPQSVRSIGASVATTVNWLVAFILGVAYLPLQDVIGAWSFLLFIIPASVLTVWLWIKMPETKNRRIDEIMSDWID